MRHLEERRVVTAFLEHRGRILILKRSGRVGSYRGKWAGISGYIEKDEAPLERALKEVEEEAGLTREQIRLIKKGRPLVVPDEGMGVLWIVYPFLFRTENPIIRLDEEHAEYRWIRPGEIDEYETVPMLKETFETVE